MKTLRKTAEEAYLKYANKIINRETWIDGFISGIQYKKRISTIYRALRPAAGLRDNNSGELALTSSLGCYWSSSPNYGGNGNPLNSNNRAYGFSVRCVQNK